MATLVSLLDENRHSISQTLRLCKDNWASLLSTCDPESLDRSGKLNKEETWTFLVACGYAICGSRGVVSLKEILTGRSDRGHPNDPKIWLEYRPMTPRRGERRTNLDLAIGNIAIEAGTKGGIELADDDESNSWICFCEMKWESDISPNVTNDKNRNQLVRVIESALYFQKRVVFADEVYVSLVTPRVFRGERGSEKFYQRKFAEYKSSNSKILADLGNCMLPLRDQFDAADRIDALSLRWTTYDDLFNALPDSPISSGVGGFWAKYGSYF